MGRKTKRVSNYLLKEQLGAGQFGFVHRGIDLLTNEIRAIKIIKNPINEQGRKNLSREITTMKSLNHENIVRLYDHIVTQNNNYLILEYCSGGDLSRLCTGIGEAKTVVYLRQIVSALKVLQEKKIVHRDLKPANIMLSGDNKLKLADFGLARQIDPESMAKSYVGTPLYMGPEVLLIKDKGGNNDRYTDKADIWSVGCIVYQLISGKRPFDAENLFLLLPKIQESLSSPDFFDRNVFSDICIDFLQRIFKINPDERINFQDLCEHPFVLGMPNVKPVLEINNISSLKEESLDFTKEEVLDFSEVIVNLSDRIDSPFLLHMKACMLLKSYLDDKNCVEFFKLNFEEANKLKTSITKDSKSLTQIILETVVKLCKREESASDSLREKYRTSLILLKILKPTLYVRKLKETIEEEFSRLVD